MTGDGAVVLAALGGGYAVVCRSCGGSGKRPSPSGAAYRKCPTCVGSCDRLRWGARLFGGKR